MNIDAFGRVALIGMLGAVGVSLYGEPRRLTFEERLQASLVSNEQLRLREIRGIDVRGRAIAIKSGDGRLVTFMLRHVTLSEDLRFWTEVARLVGRNPRIHLIGYCDGDACVTDLRATPVGFPVVAYGEVVAAQAMLNADARGNALITDSAHMEIPWRPSWQRPADFMEWLK